ncbi:MAG: zinc-binding dehydrogenase [Candidatus Eremiobacteraeota bacterium]|nr:zinc-binding dehydrogenase [Candidatus Eremiobacteraeota bacterium]
MMKAVRLHAIGSPDNLAIEEIAEPHPGPGEIAVAVRAAALNRRDLFITQGLYPKIELPRTLGSDGAGRVAALGSGVSEPAVGSDVVINPMLGWGDDPNVWAPDASILGMPRDGTFAQIVIVPASNVHPKPSHLSYGQAAALPLAGLTAYRALFTRGALRPGETVLITGVGGGVQTMALLFAKAAGARIVATSSSDEKLARAKALGAEFTINYARDANWQKALRAQVPPIDLALDSAGGESFAKTLGIVRPGGRVVTYGGTSGDATIKMFPVFWNHLTILGTSMGSAADFEAMLALVTRGELAPVLDGSFEMDNAPEAFRRLERSTQFGKVILAIG